MFYNDHNPPHFHVIYGEYKALISVGEPEIIDGFLPSRAKSMVFEWAKIHQSELKREWELAKEHRPLFWIEPLE